MLNDDELGRILAGEMRQIGAGVVPSKTLRRQIDAIGSRPRLARRRLISVVAIAAVSAAAVLVDSAIMTGGLSPQPAFAVTVTPAGQVRVTIRELGAIRAANAKLHELGLPVVVAEVRPGCRSRLGRSDLRHAVSTVATITTPPGSANSSSARRTARPSTVILTGGAVGHGNVVLVARNSLRNVQGSVCVSPAAIGADGHRSGGPHSSSTGNR